MINVQTESLDTGTLRKSQSRWSFQFQNNEFPAVRAQMPGIVRAHSALLTMKGHLPSRGQTFPPLVTESDVTENFLTGGVESYGL